MIATGAVHVELASVTPQSLPDSRG
eukprot:COSAG02_NODE_7308_length_3072_cov_2.627985_1_plen_24_part_10